ncbi:MAG: DUF892 family protein [Flavobacteriales bacterium]|nr:MAG: DUF892 family protein [Flavobacteriales bacterium]
MVNTDKSNSVEEKTLNKGDFKARSLSESLRTVYGAEKQWYTVLPILELAVGCEDLSEALRKFQKDGQDHLHRLKSIFESLDIVVAENENEDVEVLIEECYDIIDVTPRNSFIRDAGLIVGMQQVQQYLITAYTSLLAQALECNAQKVVNLLRVIIHNKHLEEEQLAMAGTSQMLDEIV